jgi:hypothetical protein
MDKSNPTLSFADAKTRASAQERVGHPRSGEEWKKQRRRLGHPPSPTLGVHAKVVKGGPPARSHTSMEDRTRAQALSLAREVKERVLNGTAEARALIQTCTRRAVPHLRRSPDCEPLRAAGPIPRASQKLVKDLDGVDVRLSEQHVVGLALCWALHSVRSTRCRAEHFAKIRRQM